MDSQLIAVIAAVVVLIVLIAAYKLILRIFGVIIIPKDSIGIVNKKFVLLGANRTLPDGEVIALKGEAGIQADTLPPGIHFWLFPWQYSVSVQPFMTVDQGKIGIVEARGGQPLSGGRVLGKTVECDSFQSVRLFLGNGGQRGPQIAIIPPGTYRINTAFFDLKVAPVTEIDDNTVGIVTVKDGNALPSGEIAGKEVGGHNLFQDGQAFIDAGGYKGLQEQVINAGRYFINPLFATVEVMNMTEVPIAHVGVVIAYVGSPGQDVTGDAFKHGNLVSRGENIIHAASIGVGSCWRCCLSARLSASMAMLKDCVEKQEKISMDSLSYIIANINYGGRVTEEWDRKVLESTLRIYVNPKMLKKTDFSFDISSVYILPASNKMEDFIQTIKKLPENDE